MLTFQQLKKEAPGIIPLLPMLYVAWADAVLTPSEINSIKNKITSQRWLNAKEAEILEQLLQPTSPPSDAELRSWVQIIQRSAKDIPATDKESLVDMGMAIAKINMDNTDFPMASEEAQAALREIESALDVVSLEVPGNILTKEKTETGGAKSDKSAFQPEEMQHFLEANHHQLRKKVRQIITDDLLAYQPVTNKEDYRETILAWAKVLAKQGFGALAYPKEYGGTGDMSQFIAVFETIGYHDLSLTIKFGVQFGLFGGAIANLGTESHHQKYLLKTGTLEYAGCFAMTETGHGSNVRQLETTATYNPETQEFVIHSPTVSSRKEYIGNALHSRYAAVFAQLQTQGEGQGVHAFVLQLRDENHHLMPGVSVEDCGYKMGLNGVDNGKIWFDQVRIPRENLLDKYGQVAPDGTYSSPIKSEGKRFFTMLGTLVGGRVNVPFAGLSAAKAGLTIAVKYALVRRQFGPENEPETLLLDYPTHQRRLLPLLAKAYAIDFGLTYLAKRYSEKTEADMREIETLAAGLKSYGTWFTTHCLQMCREACGGKGYLAENRFTALKADTDIFTTFEGDNTVLMQLVAKGLLTSFKHEFGSSGAFGVLKYLSEQASQTLAEYNPLFGRNADQEHLRSLDFLKDAFAYRERKQLMQVADRLRKHIKRGMKSQDAFLRVQNQFLTLANAFVERLILDQFIDGIQRCDNPSLKPILNQLCCLYALWQIEEDKGWFLESGYMEAAKTKAIRRQIDKLCWEIRPHALALVESFGIPDACLAAPIATYQ